jgi:hypothetical protein
MLTRDIINAFKGYMHAILPKLHTLSLVICYE